jgi:hypothetical protein
MRFCFIIEDQDTHASLPTAIVDQLRKWDYRVDILEPQTSISSMCDLTTLHYDAYLFDEVRRKYL